MPRGDAPYRATGPPGRTTGPHQRRPPRPGGTPAQRRLHVERVDLGGAAFGAYLDELHLNKRAAYFTVMALDYLGSMNLADSANTYNLRPDTVRPGDMLIERWQRSGIGHTLVVKEVAVLGEANLDLTTISGSMPRRQGKRESGVASKGYFTSAYAGGPGENLDGDAYARLGGGAKRFRVAKNVNGYWTNTWMRGDEAVTGPKMVAKATSAAESRPPTRNSLPSDTAAETSSDFGAASSNSARS